MTQPTHLTCGQGDYVIDGAVVDLSTPEGWGAFFAAPLAQAESQADGHADAYPNGCPILESDD